jgi:tetratricopeptide (TPR) repeat protein
MAEGKLGHRQQAVEIFQKVVRLQPNSSLARLNFGITLADRYDLEGALEQFSEAIRLDPQSPAAHYNKGRVLYDLNRREMAGAELETACKLRPDYPAALYLLSLIERQLGNVQRSTELAERLVQLTPNDADAQSLLGQDLLRLGKTDEAIEHLRRAVEANPQNSEGLYNLARTLAQAGKPEAKEYMNRFDQLEKQRQLTDRVQQLGNFGLEAANARNWPQAIEDLQEALQICSDCRFSADLHRDLGLIYCRKGDLQNGKRELEAALQLQPRDPDARQAMEVIASLEKRGP